MFAPHHLFRSNLTATCTIAFSLQRAPASPNTISLSRSRFILPSVLTQSAWISLHRTFFYLIILIHQQLCPAVTVIHRIAHRGKNFAHDAFPAPYSACYRCQHSFMILLHTLDNIFHTVRSETEIVIHTWKSRKSNRQFFDTGTRLSIVHISFDRIVVIISTHRHKITDLYF